MTTSTTGAALFVDALERYGVEYVFGNPGTTELPILEAIDQTDLEYVLALHEDVAVGMAAGYAQTRRYHAQEDESIRPVGVVNLHVAPGLAHGLGNLHGAAAAGAPLVVTAGNHGTGVRHQEPILSGDLARTAAAHCTWSDEVLDVAALPTMLRRAFRVATTPPTGPVFLGLPLDVLLAETDDEPERLGPVPTAGGGDPAQLERAATLLVAADRPVLVVGDGVARAGRNAVAAAVEFAEATGARVHGEILSSEVAFPTEHDQWVSHVPPDGKLARRLFDAETIVFAGCSTNATVTGHEKPIVDRGTVCIHLGADAWQLGKNRPADAAILGDPGVVLDELATRVRTRLPEDERRDRLEDAVATADTVATKLAAGGSSSGNGRPGDRRATVDDLVEAIERVAADAFVVDESVTAKHALLSRVPLEPTQYVSNKGGGLGYGLPAAVGAALAESDRGESSDVIAFVGDGSYYYYPQAIYSAVRRRIDLTVVVANNRRYRALEENANSLLGSNRSDVVGTDIDPAVDPVRSARSYGARGERVETADEIEAALADALARDGVDVVDVRLRE
ncbi:thiamine pyrophosphate-binding protein [Natrarchaeobius oligotrophus]|uniref:Thiamine pyrophosphate-binding protein n=1 Tax=Natrarchaeobius chitinivorans TaxID=1679083 RepID=A0A3N6NKU2_NATCH|nr:thiamine pyrophosphate-binding protein [Natrarchaeobius chitinivorans]RQG99912.1 thiamine pyrophosphate-binding protein [Natrarchaeobius chitinivorans]